MTEDSRKHMLTFKSESVIRHHILQFTTDFAIRSSAQRNHAVLCTQQQIQTFFFCKELLDIPGGITRCRAKLFRGAIEVLMCWSSKFILDINLSNEATKLTKATTSAWPASTKTSAHISAAWDHITATQSSQVQKCCKAIFHQCSSYFHMFPKIYRIAHRFPRFLLFVFLAFQTRFEVVLASKKKSHPILEFSDIFFIWGLENLVFWWRMLNTQKLLDGTIPIQPVPISVPISTHFPSPPDGADPLRLAETELGFRCQSGCLWIFESLKMWLLWLFENGLHILLSGL